MPGVGEVGDGLEGCGLSTRRFRKAVPQSQWGKPDRDDQGRPLCRQCRGVIPAEARQRCYCSVACRERFLIAGGGDYARRLVKRRDKGICAVCGIDCLWLEQVRRTVWHDDAINSKPVWNDRSEEAERLRKAVRRFRRLGEWQADHIKPVVEGGGECGLENLRTLCWECHNRETAALARRRAAARREKAAALFVTTEKP